MSEFSARAERLSEAVGLVDSPDLRDRAWVAYVKAHEVWLDQQDPLQGIEDGYTYVGAGVWRRADGSLVLNPWDAQ